MRTICLAVLSAATCIFFSAVVLAADPTPVPARSDTAQHGEKNKVEPAKKANIERWEQFNPSEAEVTFRMSSGRTVYDGSGQLASVEGTLVRKFAINGSDIELVSNNINMENKNLVFATKKYGKIRVTQGDNFSVRLWVKPSQKRKILNDFVNNKRE